MVLSSALAAGVVDYATSALANDDPTLKKIPNVSRSSINSGNMAGRTRLRSAKAMRPGQNRDWV